MAKIIIDGESVPAFSLFNAPSFAVIALQRDIGLRLEEIVTQAQDPREQAWATKVQEFLAEHARGNRVTFDELLERPMPQYVLEADDLAQRGPVEQGAADAVDPTEAGTVTPADPGHVQPSEPSTVTPNRAERRASTHRSSGSGKKNRGSKGKSARA